jgi:transglycosylase-like protein with SLT domain
MAAEGISDRVTAYGDQRITCETEREYSWDTRDTAQWVACRPLRAMRKELNVGDITQVEANIHAGLKYFRFMIDQYFKDEPMDKLNQGLFTFAAYNAGPGRIGQLRREAEKRGLDPNVQFGNVEQIASERIGRETVTYVSNIDKHYVAIDCSPRSVRAGRPQKLRSSRAASSRSGLIEEKSEHGRQFDGQMRGKALKRRQANRVIHQVSELFEKATAGDRRAVGGDVPSIAAVAHGERLLQDGVDLLGPGGARMISCELSPHPHSSRARSSADPLTSLLSTISSKSWSKRTGTPRASRVSFRSAAVLKYSRKPVARVA